MSLKKNFEYIRDWCNAKFLKKTDQVDVDLSNYYTKSEIESNIGSALEDLSDSAVWETQDGGGIAVKNKECISSGNNSVSEGYNTYAVGAGSHAEGIQTFAWGPNSHAEGNGTIAKGNSSHVEGQYTIAYGNSSHAEGQGSMASVYDVSVNGTTLTKNGESFYVGQILRVENGSGEEYTREFMRVVSVPSSGTCVVNSVPNWWTGGTLLKVNSCSYGDNSHTEGWNTIALNTYEHAEGSYNKSNQTSNTFGNAGNTTFSHGIGNYSNRKNAIEIMENGDAYLYGVGGYDGTNYASATTLQNAITNAGSTKLDIATYEVDEEVIAAALNDLNNRINNFDNRTYSKGAILDLTGEDNPNYTFVSNSYRLTEKALLAVTQNKIGMIMAPLSALSDYLSNLENNIYTVQVAPYFITSTPLDSSGNAISGVHKFVLSKLNEGNMSEDDRNVEDQSSISWYNGFYELTINDSTGIITITSTTN